MSHLVSLFAFITLLAVVGASAPSGSWDAFNYAPDSRTVRPVSIFATGGSVSLATASSLLTTLGIATLSGNGTFVSLDFGKEVGGLISFNLDPATQSSSFSFSFSESSLYARPDASDDSTYPQEDTLYDGVETESGSLSPGLWTQPSRWLRGGFRYLTIVSNSDDALSISNITCAISFSPNSENLRDYAGYFTTKDLISADEDFLTKLWYAGAYTVQTNVVPLNTGRQIPVLASGWANNATLGVAGPIIVDGAKRDRAVWPGDMGIAVPTAFVSTNDLEPVKNALSTMFAYINPTTGALPESGPPLSQLNSDTYHCWTLIGTYNYYLFTGDMDWLQSVWSNYTKAVSYINGKQTANGLINVTGTRDWARQATGGVESEANAIFYKMLTNSVLLASYLNDTDLADGYASNASVVKQSFNDVFWDASQGMYVDNATTTLTPQDANSFGILFNLTLNQSQADSISQGLTKNWVEYGAVAPELPDNISPFIGGFEIQAHFESGNDERALDLIRREWGYMLTTNISVQSTLLEGFTSNGSLGYRSYQGYNYDPSYTSHAHGWSSGPTSALTNYVLGLQVTAPMGKEWTLAPHTSGLSSAEGGFETPLGWFGTSWALVDSGMNINVSTPQGTTGIVTLANATSVTIDGEAVGFDETAKFHLTGGNHTIRSTS